MFIIDMTGEMFFHGVSVGFLMYDGKWYHYQHGYEYTKMPTRDDVIDSVLSLYL